MNPKNKKILKISLISLASAVLLFITVCFCIANYTLNYALHQQKKQTELYSDESHWLNQKSEIISIKSFDNLTLNGFLALQKNSTHKYGLFMHGYRDSPFKMADYALHFYEKGWNVLLPGQRGHSFSDGNYVDMGNFACQDAKAWVEKICQLDPEAEILLYGVSMGAATIMNTTGLALPENVKCAVEDCGFSSTWDQFKYRLSYEFHLPAFPILNMASALCKTRYGFNFKTTESYKSIQKSKTPTIFIHGDIDTYVPFYMLDIVFEKAACTKEKVVIPNAPHAKSIYTNPELYWNSIDTFVSKYIK